MLLKKKVKRVFCALKSRLNVAVSPVVQSLHGERFFCVSLMWPEGILDKDKHAFLALQLEALSPFPLDQLYWGSFESTQSRNVLVYAAYKPTLKGADFENQNAPLQWPSFLFACGQMLDHDSWVLFQHDQTLSALQFEANNPVPLRVESLSLSESLSPDSQRRRREEWIERLSLKEDLSNVSVLSVAKTPYCHRKSIQWQLKSKDRAAQLSVPYFHKRTWKMDVRDAVVSDKACSIKQWSYRLEKGYLVLALVLLFLLGGVGTQSIGQILLRQKEKRVQHQAPVVALIEGKESLLQRLREQCGLSWRPFDVLAEINKVRDKNVYFKSLMFDFPQKILVEGKADNINGVNAYVKKLRELQLFKDVDLPQIHSKSGQVDFKLILTLNVSS